MKKCECGTEFEINNSDAVMISVGDLEKKSWLHACVCPQCSRIYWYRTGEPVMTFKKEILFSVSGRAARKNGNGFEFI